MTKGWLSDIKRLQTELSTLRGKVAKTRRLDKGYVYYCKGCGETFEKEKEKGKVDVSGPRRCTEDIKVWE